MPSPLSTPVQQPKSSIKPKPPCKVIVMDDPVNTIDYVIYVLRKIFDLNKEKATELTMQVHEKGQSIVWTGDRERAELYVSQLHGFQLQAKLEQSE